MRPASPAGAGNGATQIEGVAGFHAFGFTEECPGVDGYEDFNMFTLKLNEGNLQGCWYTLVEDSKFSPNADASPVVYQERGREVFHGKWYADDGTLIGEGTFETTYKFTSKWTDATLIEEIHGRCQHPLVAGTGTGIFEGMTGRVDFKDDVSTGDLNFRGHLK